MRLSTVLRRAAIGVFLAVIFGLLWIANRQPGPTTTGQLIEVCMRIDENGNSTYNFYCGSTCRLPNGCTYTTPPQCGDTIDNETIPDGLIDRDDPGCWDVPGQPNSFNPNLDNEAANTSQCQDGRENDGDGVYDQEDPGCWTDPYNPATYNRLWNAENRTTPECGDGMDNEGDGVWDINDPGCYTAGVFNRTLHNEAAATTQCQDNIDNDGDGLNNFPNDPGCTALTDNRELNNQPQCSDGVDNDGDGFTDYPADAGCSSASGTDEGSDHFPHGVASRINPPESGDASCPIIIVWACDPDDYDAAVTVQFYSGGGPGVGTPVGSVVAGNFYGDIAVGQFCGGRTSHYGTFVLPPSLRGIGQQHQIYAIGMNAAGPGPDRQLVSLHSGDFSPISVSCIQPPPPVCRNDYVCGSSSSSTPPSSSSSSSSSSSVSSSSSSSLSSSSSSSSSSAGNLYCCVGGDQCVQSTACANPVPLNQCLQSCPGFSSSSSRSSSFSSASSSVSNLYCCVNGDQCVQGGSCANPQTLNQCLQSCGAPSSSSSSSRSSSSSSSSVSNLYCCVNGSQCVQGGSCANPQTLNQCLQSCPASSSSSSASGGPRCQGNACVSSGNQFCALTGRNCVLNSQSATCYVCVTASSSSHSSSSSRFSSSSTSITPQSCNPLQCVQQCGSDRCVLQRENNGACIAHCFPNGSSSSTNGNVSGDDSGAVAGDNSGAIAGDNSGANSGDNSGTNSGDFQSSSTAPVAICGDGIVQPAAGEQCDDGAGNSAPGTPGAQCTCNPEDPSCSGLPESRWDGCIAASCGDGIVGNPFLLAGKSVDFQGIHELCDNGSLNGTPGNPCSAACQVLPSPFCGNGSLDAGEQCDDNNGLDGDGCSTLCVIERPSAPLFGQNSGTNSGPFTIDLLAGLISGDNSGDNSGANSGTNSGDLSGALDHAPAGETGPGAVIAIAAGAAAGFAYMRRRRLALDRGTS